MAQSRRYVLHVPTKMAGQALGAVLRSWQTDQSWSEIKQLLKARRVMVDGNLATEPQMRIRSGQVIKLLPHALPRPTSDDDIRILHVDADIVIVEKPAGITSIRHPDEARLSPRRQQRQLTLTEILPRILARKLRSSSGKTQRAAVHAVHRLDRETSGLMVFARNKRAERSLGQQFREHSIKRVYWAVVAGDIEAQSIDVNLIADRGDGRRGVTSRRDLGKRAVTHVRPLERLRGATLVECRLETGRTHQIRIHLADRGHPVLGDKVYGSRPTSRSAAGLASSRLALHAGRLGFLHPTTNRLMEYEAHIPEDMAQLIKKLGQRDG